MNVLLVSHVLVSLVAIVAGFAVAYSFVIGKRNEFWMTAFLVTTIATSASGFLFPADHVTPGHVVGVLSLVALTVAAVTKSSERIVGAWSRTHIVSVVMLFLFQHVCPGCSDVPEDTGSAQFCSKRIGTAICSGSIAGGGRIRCGGVPFSASQPSFGSERYHPNFASRNALAGSKRLSTREIPSWILRVRATK